MIFYRAEVKNNKNSPLLDTDTYFGASKEHLDISLLIFF